MISYFNVQLSHEADDAVVYARISGGGAAIEIGDATITFAGPDARVRAVATLRRLADEVEALPGGDDDG